MSKPEKTLLRPQIRELLYTLCSAPGPSGAEDGIRETLTRLLGAERCKTDRFGNLCVEISAKKEGSPVIMLTAHMDQVSFIVSKTEADGSVILKAAGGIDRRTLCGSDIVIYTRSGPVPAVVVSGQREVCAADSVIAETGLPPDRSPVAPGDRAVFEFLAAEPGDGYLCCPALDDRAGCAALVLAAGQIKTPREFGIYLIFTAQEELGARGGGCGAQSVSADAAVVVDVSFGDTPGVAADKTGKMGGGPMLGFAPILDGPLTAALERTAQKLCMTFQPEVMGASTGTDSERIAVANGGVRTAMVSIPVRNMHTQCETVFYSDVADCADLLASFVDGLKVKDGGFDV